MSEATLYRAFALLLGGPRYYEELKSLPLEELPDGQLHRDVERVLGIYEGGDLDALKTEYTSCFVNGYPSLPCPPYESWYRERTMAGRSAYRLSLWYRKYGLRPTVTAEDHISAILEFASYLYARGESGAARGFLREHFLTWARELARDVREKCSGEYARALGEALEHLVEYASSRPEEG